MPGVVIVGTAATATAVPFVKLRGHAGQVLCLDPSDSGVANNTTTISSSLLLLSGSEDRTARLWDVGRCSAAVRACLCITCPGEVLAVSFQPPTTVATATTTAATSTLYDETSNNSTNNNNNTNTNSALSDLRKFHKKKGGRSRRRGGRNNQRQNRKSNASKSHVDEEEDDNNHDESDNVNEDDEQEEQGGAPSQDPCCETVEATTAISQQQSQQPQQQSPFLASSSPFAKDYTVFLGVENEVYLYDLRRVTSPVASIPMTTTDSPHVLPYSKCLTALDQVNQLAFSYNNNYMGTVARGQQPPAQPQPLYLATADDAGIVHVTSADWCCASFTTATPTAATAAVSFGWNELSHGTEENMAMVTSIAFRPARGHDSKHISNNNKQQQQSVLLASGGTDCTIHLWDVNTTTRTDVPPVASWVVPSTDSGTNQVCNPPMVHSLAWSPTGQFLAAGLGDGSCCLFTTQTQQQPQSLANKSKSKNHSNNNNNRNQSCKLVPMFRLEQAHAGSVASVLFPGSYRHDDTTTTTTTTSSHLYNTYDDDRLLLSTGNDGKIACWDLGNNNSLGVHKKDKKDDYYDPVHRMQEKMHREYNNNSRGDKDSTSSSTFTVVDSQGWVELEGVHSSLLQHQQQPKDNRNDMDETLLLLPRMLWSIPHGHKPNWMTFQYEQMEFSTLFVADTTHDITVYKVPI